MNTIIQSQLDRVETALSTLIDSIASYKPSISAATNLLVADDHLQEGLKQLAQHQRNHARILQLHDKIAGRNDQITSTLTTLANVRTELLSIPISLPAPDARKIPYTELLEYAKRISRNTVPPRSRPHPPPPPLPDVQLAAAETPVMNGSSDDAMEPTSKGIGMGTEALENAERHWLEPLMQIPFVPWVNDDVMRRGALTQIQAMVERGEDPATVNKDKGESGGEETGDAMDEGGEVREEVRREEGHVKKPEQPKVFGGLDLYDPDSPDEME